MARCSTCFVSNEAPAAGMVAGKVDLNTRQAPVLQAIVAGAYRDELASGTAAPTYALPPLTSTEAANVANSLVTIRTGTEALAGPLGNVGELVGHYVGAISGSASALARGSICLRGGVRDSLIYMEG